jgi:hypothetical protein
MAAEDDPAERAKRCQAVKEIHRARRAAKVCINNVEHGRAYKGGRCRACWDAKEKRAAELKADPTLPRRRRGRKPAVDRGSILRPDPDIGGDRIANDNDPAPSPALPPDPGSGAPAAATEPSSPIGDDEEPGRG